jgi:hypothetical protein
MDPPESSPEYSAEQIETFNLQPEQDQLLDLASTVMRLSLEVHSLQEKYGPVFPRAFLAPADREDTSDCQEQSYLAYAFRGHVEPFGIGPGRLWNMALGEIYWPVEIDDEGEDTQTGETSLTTYRFIWSAEKVSHVSRVIESEFDLTENMWILDDRNMTNFVMQTEKVSQADCAKLIEDVGAFTGNIRESYQP